MFKKKCDVCYQLKHRHLTTPEDFLECLQLFKSLLESGNFEYVTSNFELEQPKRNNGCWQDDTMEYIIRCKACGRKYCCFCDTYHGRASLDRIR